MSKYNVCTPHKVDYNLLEQEILNNVIKTCKTIKTENLEKLLKVNDKLSNLKIETETELKNKLLSIKSIDNKTKNLYEDKLSGLIDKNIYLEFKEK